MHMNFFHWAGQDNPGTAAIKQPSLVKELADEFGGDRIMVALDSKNGKVTTHGWAEQSAFSAVELGRKFEKLGAGSILFTDINTEGLLQGVNRHLQRNLWMRWKSGHSIGRNNHIIGY